MKARVIFISILSITLIALAGHAQRELTEKDWETIRKGGVVRESFPEGGTQNRGWGVGVFKVPIDVMWEALCSLELYDEFVSRTTVSVLLDEKTRDKVVKENPFYADDAEKLFAGNQRGYVKRDPANPDRYVVYSYQRNSFPWPVNDRWVLLEMEHDNKTHTQKWHRLAGNMKEDYGVWVLEPFEGDKTLGRLEIHVDLAIPATGPLTNFAMSVTLPDTYKSFEYIGLYLMKQKKEEKK